MKVIIDISEDYYEIIKHDVQGGNDYLPFKLIAKGTLLPKGHGDLIDRGKTVERICKVAEFMNEKRENLGSPYIMAALFIQDNKEEFPTIIKADKEAEDEDHI